MTEAERAANPPTDFLRPIIADGDTGHGLVPSFLPSFANDDYHYLW